MKEINYLPAIRVSQTIADKMKGVQHKRRLRSSISRFKRVVKHLFSAWLNENSIVDCSAFAPRLRFKEHDMLFGAIVNYDPVNHRANFYVVVFEQQDNLETTPWQELDIFTLNTYRG